MRASIDARAVVATGSEVGDGASILSSVVLAGCADRAWCCGLDSILAPGVWIGEGASIGPDAVIGEGARVEAGTELEAGARLAPGELVLLTGNDRSNLLDDVLALPDHLSDALWRVESARIEPFDAPGGLVVCGMGGSAIGGDLAAVAFGNRLSRPLTTERGYELPFAMLPDRAVLCSSYSGDTEETIACYEAAEALGARRIVATHGRPPCQGRARRRRAGDRPAGRAPAPRRGRIHVHGRRRGRGPDRSGAAASAPRSTAPARI